LVGASIPELVDNPWLVHDGSKVLAVDLAVIVDVHDVERGVEDRPLRIV